MPLLAAAAERHWRIIESNPHDVDALRDVERLSQQLKQWDRLDAALERRLQSNVTDDDRLAVSEMVRVLRPGGRIALFCPNRWYPVEQHGVYWRGRYKFGNIPLVNYLPNPLRDRLAPHVRAYTAGRLLGLTNGLPVEVVHHGRIYGGYDNIEHLWPRFGRALKKALYAAEKTPLAGLGISHFLVLEKTV